MEQSSQLLLASKSWKFYEYPSTCYSVIFLTNTDPENIKINSISDGLNATSPKCSRLFLLSCHSPKLSWESIYPFYRNVANRHAAVPRWETVKQSSQAWNGLAMSFLCRAWHIMNELNELNLIVNISQIKCESTIYCACSIVVASRMVDKWIMRDREYVVIILISSYAWRDTSGSWNYIKECWKL